MIKNILHNVATFLVGSSAPAPNVRIYNNYCCVTRYVINPVEVLPSMGFSFLL